MLGEIVLSPFVVRLVGLIAGNLEHFGKKVYFDEVDDEGISKVEDEFDSEHRVELVVDLNPFVVEEVV